MSTSQRVWLVILLTIFGGAAIEQLMDMDTLPSLMVGLVAAVIIALSMSAVLLGLKPHRRILRRRRESSEQQHSGSVAHSAG